MTPPTGVPALRVVDPDDEKTYALVEVSGPHPQRAVKPAPVCVLPPVPTGVISDKTAKQMLRAMLDDGRVASSGPPLALVVALILGVLGIVGLFAALWGAWA